MADRPSIEELIAASSLGEPDVVAARATVSDELVARVLARAQELASDDGERFCGCCGHEIPAWLSGAGMDDWCRECLPHLAPHPPGTSMPPWERTWFYQYGTDCPYQVEA